ncbi:MAG: acyltransferase family protein [Deltaproteobacteria bacterium]|nr:acyltransferase family protein [Deltaproteobacteria bacterium]MBW2394161.1 acyltransferase family protein [Deltaproteobacteria bacterium]
MEPPNPLTDSRRADIDKLRILACYLLFLFHVAIVFAPMPFYHIQNREVSGVFAAVVGFISLWHMPLFFLLAGWSAFGSLSKRGARGFSRERLLKLALPLVAICIAFGPIIKFVELSSGFDANYLGLHVSPENAEHFRSTIGAELPLMTPFAESFADFWPTYFTQLDRFTWSHLWFVAYLFVFSLLYLPFFTALVRRKIQIEQVSAGWVWAPILPLVLIQVTLRPHFPGLQTLWSDWANFGYYSTFLMLGFLMARFPAYEEALHRQWRRALAVASATTLFLLGSLLGIVTSEPLILAGSAVAGWCFVVALLGFANERLAAPTRGLPAWSESAYPVYLLHQPSIVVLATIIVPLAMSLWLKFALLLAGSVALTLTVYHLVVRRGALLRFLLGMKQAARSATTTPAGANIAPVGARQ